jgi:Na+/melibiose symporter-like transporter
MNETNQLRELHGFRLFGYSIGQFGFFLTRVLISIFAFQFYVYTINLDSIFASIGLSITFILNATSMIIFGVITDRKKPGKYGKRRPFILYGLPIWIITSILIWFPFQFCPKNNSFYLPVAIFYWTVLFSGAISGSCILSAHVSMLPEQSQTYKNREKVAVWRTVFMIIASILALMLPLMVESILKDPENVKWWQPSGKVILFYMPLIGVSFALFGLFSLLLTYFSVDESFHKKISGSNKENLTLGETFQRMIIPTKDKKFRQYLSVAFFNSMAARTFGVLIIPLLTYSLKFRGPEYMIYVVVSIVGKFSWFYVWKKLQGRFELLKTYSMCLMIATIVGFLELIYLVEILSFEIKVVFFVIIVGTILGSLYALNLFTNPLVSALIYESAMKKNEGQIDKGVSNISGSYFGLASFTMSIAQAIATLIVGIILTGPNKENSTIITITFSFIGLFYLISLIFLSRIHLDQSVIDIVETRKIIKKASEIEDYSQIEIE